MRTVYFLLLFASLGHGYGLQKTPQTWVGTGRFVDRDGMFKICENMLFVIQRGKGRFIVQKAQYRCGKFTGIWEKLDFSLKDGKIYFRDGPVGHVNGDHLEIRRFLGGRTVTVKFHFQRHTLFYEERQADKEGLFIHRIDALLRDH